MAGPDRGHPRGPISRRLKRADGGSTSGSLSLLFDHLAAAVLLTARLPSAGWLDSRCQRANDSWRHWEPHSDVIAAVLATEGRAKPPSRTAAPGARRDGRNPVPTRSPQVAPAIPDHRSEVGSRRLH